MVRHLRGALQRAAVLQIGGDARGTKDVVADACGDASGFRAPLNHRVGVGLGQGVAGELAGRATVGLEQQRLRFARQSRAVDMFVQVSFEVLMGWTPPDGIDVPKWRCWGGVHEKS